MKQSDYEEAELLHAGVMQKDTESLVYKNLTMAFNFQTLLELAAKVVLAHSGDDQENAINELEEYLR